MGTQSTGSPQVQIPSSFFGEKIMHIEGFGLGQRGESGSKESADKDHHRCSK